MTYNQSVKMTRLFVLFFIANLYNLTDLMMKKLLS